MKRQNWISFRKAGVKWTLALLEALAIDAARCKTLPQGKQAKNLYTFPSTSKSILEGWLERQDDVSSTKQISPSFSMARRTRHSSTKILLQEQTSTSLKPPPPENWNLGPAAWWDQTNNPRWRIFYPSDDQRYTMNALLLLQLNIKRKRDTNKPPVFSLNPLKPLQIFGQ